MVNIRDHAASSFVWEHQDVFNHADMWPEDGTQHTPNKLVIGFFSKRKSGEQLKSIVSRKS
jgi:hypothetical protein